MKRFLAASIAVAAVLFLAAAPAGATPIAAARWAAMGPHKVKVKIELVHTFYYPEDIQRGQRLPVILWGNGTFAIPGVYSALLRHLASHGFIVAAANTTQSNFAISMLNGIDQLASRDKDERSDFYRRVDLANVGVSGHSQGGAGALNAAADQRVKTTVAIQPGPLADAGKVLGPTLILAGQKDVIVPPIGSKTILPSWLGSFYDKLSHVPAVYAERAGADHLAIVNKGGGFSAVTTAWFRFHLMGDDQARGVFFGPDYELLRDPAWSQIKRNAKADVY